MLKVLNNLNQLMSVIGDKFTGFLVSITGDHTYIHQGIAYMANHFISTLASASSVKLTFITPVNTSGYIHMRLPTIISSGDKVMLDLYEGSSGDSGGTAITPMNRNRNSSHTSASVLKHGVTVTTNGTLISKYYIGGGTGVGGARSGSESGDVDEIVLKTNTKYTIIVTNGSSAANDILVKLSWYEEGNG